MGWFAPESVLTVEITPIQPVGTDPLEVAWYGRLPAGSCLPKTSAQFVVLYRMIMAEKLWQDAAGLHWSFLDPSDDPVIKWFPTILDQPDACQALCTLWERLPSPGGMILTSYSRDNVGKLVNLFRGCVLRLYPILAENPAPSLEEPAALQCRKERLNSFLLQKPIKSADGAMELVKPFNTSELLSDTVTSLISPEEAIYASTEAGGHFGDQARGEILLLIGRLIELLDRGLGMGDYSKNGSKCFYSFFDAALPKSAIQNLMQWNRQSLEEVEAAFRKKELRHTPQSAHQTLLALSQAEAKVEFRDPYHAEMAFEGGKVYFVSTANAPSAWHMSEDFFFAEPPSSPRNRSPH